MKTIISLSSNIKMTPLQYAEEIIRGAFNKPDSPFRESEIKKSMKGKGLCHGHTAKFIRDSRFSPDLYIVVMGNSFVVHSIVTDSNGVVFDRDGDDFQYINNKEVKYTYANKPFKILGIYNVGKLIGPYMNNGTYIQVEPDNFSTQAINSILAKAKIPVSSRKTDLHCTLMYSPQKDYIQFISEKKYVPDLNSVYNAKVIGARILGESPVLSLALILECPELEVAHSKMKAAGLKHTFPKLLQHITVSSGNESTMNSYLKNLDKILVDNQFSVKLVNESASALKPT